MNRRPRSTSWPRQKILVVEPSPPELTMEELRAPLPEIPIAAEREEVEEEDSELAAQGIPEVASYSWYQESVVHERQEAMRRAQLLPLGDHGSGDHPDPVTPPSNDDAGVAEEVERENADQALQLPIDERSGPEIMHLINRMVEGTDADNDDQVDLVLDSSEAVIELDAEIQETTPNATEIVASTTADQDPQEESEEVSSRNRDPRGAREGVETVEGPVEAPQIHPDPRFVPIETWSDRAVNAEQSSPDDAEPRVVTDREESVVRLRGPNGRRRRYNEKRHLEYIDYVPAVLDTRRRPLSPMVPTRNDPDPRPWSPERRPRPDTMTKYKTRGTMFGDLHPIPHDPRVDPPARTCFNCWREGHSKQNCPRPQVHKYCFNCGRRGVDMETCPRCCDAYQTFVRERTNSERYRAAQERGRTRERSSERRVRIQDLVRRDRMPELGRDRTPIRNRGRSEPARRGPTSPSPSPPRSHNRASR